MTIACPIDDKDDAIQKVSAIVLSQQGYSSYSGPTVGATYEGGKWGVVGGYSSLGGGFMSQLAGLLSPPKEPTNWYGGFLGVIMWFCVFIYELFGIGITLLGLVALFRLDPKIHGSLLEIAAFILGGITFCIYMFWVGVIRIKAKYKKEMKIWEAKIGPWQRLYYCFRHDIVIDSETGDNFPPQQMASYLKQFIK